MDFSRVAAVLDSFCAQERPRQPAPSLVSVNRGASHAKPKRKGAFRKEKHCSACGVLFEPVSCWDWKCRSCVDTKDRRGEKRFCRQCGDVFLLSKPQGYNKRHCSESCARTGAKESRCKFYATRPLRDKVYRERAKIRRPQDGQLIRFWRRYPNAPHHCQGCPDGKPCKEWRVLDLCHRPEFKRNGAWHTKANSTPEKVWILCPRCHGLLDRFGMSPDELGLPSGPIA